MRLKDKVIKSMEMAEGSSQRPLVAAIVGRVEDDGADVTCTVIQNVSSVVKRLSSLATINVHCE